MLAPLSIEQFHRRFLQEGAPYWWAFDAHRKREVVAKFRDDDPDMDDNEEKIEYAWMQLEELFQTHPYGHLMVVAKTSPTANKDKSATFYVKWGDSSQPSSYAAGRGGVAATTQQSGAPGWQMFQFMLQQQQQFYDQVLKNQGENVRLNFENQRLAEAIEGAEAPSMQQELLKEGIGVLKTMMAPRIQPHPQTAALGTVGQKQRPSPDSDGPAPRPVSLDAIMADVTLIRNSMPGYHINDVMRALALFASQNPQQAEMFIGPMIQQMHQDNESIE